jgi:hypothetical protein
VELALDLAPDLANFGENQYFAVSGNYMQFLGEEGTFYWKAGGGVVAELAEGSPGSDWNKYLVLEGGGGIWLPIGEDLNTYLTAVVQLPFGEDFERPATVFAVTYGMDF